MDKIDVFNYIDPYVVIFLIAIGFIIKHTAIFSKLKNAYIPVILLVLSLMYSLIMINGMSKAAVLNAIINAIINAAVAIGLQSSGKSFLFSIDQATSTSDDEPKDDDIEPEDEEEYVEEEDRE